MAKTELYIEVSDSLNLKVLRIFDTSHFCDEVIENYLLEVLPVNKSNWVTFPVLKGFSLSVNSSSLGYKKVSDVDCLIDLPDGIYEFKQSYKPNIHTLQHYSHLRVVEMRVKLSHEWNKLVDDTCKLSKEEFFKQRDKLREIDEYLTAAKYKVDECGDKIKGKELYEWAQKLLKIYTNECQC